MMTATMLRRDADLLIFLSIDGDVWRFRLPVTAE